MASLGELALERRGKRRWLVVLSSFSEDPRLDPVRTWQRFCFHPH